MIQSYIFLTCFLCAIFVQCDITNLGPYVIATKGAVWPKPQNQNVSEQYLVLRPRNFKFALSPKSTNCNLLQNGLERYWKIIQENSIIVEKELSYQNHQRHKKRWLLEDAFLGYLDQLTVNLTGTCNDNEYPTIDMVEKYKLTVTSVKVELQADSVWGILRGLETFSQLIYLGIDGLSLRVNSTNILDYPRYKHRGLLLDTARHYLPMEKIYETLDALSYNKMNVFHWHIIDDQSFPYVSQKFPELSELGAYNPHTQIYSPEDVQSAIEYARVRGIRVIPEYDTPGHTRSWGASHPELLTSCFGDYGPIDPSKNSTYTFLNELFSEVKQVFKDNFIHLGGDEVAFDCWQVNLNISRFMKKKNITSYENLESYYIQKVIEMVNDLKLNSIVWEEVFSNGVKLPGSTIIHVWKNGWRTTIKEVTLTGRPALLSACWYLDNLQSGGDWVDFYLCDPENFGGNKTQQKLVMGGEACMWGESVNQYNLMSRVWPRASAPAEKLWSAYEMISNTNEAARRLEEHTCRMNRRGIGAEPPNGPGFCD